MNLELITSILKVSGYETEKELMMPFPENITWFGSNGKYVSLYLNDDNEWMLEACDEILEPEQEVVTNEAIAAGKMAELIKKYSN